MASLSTTDMERLVAVWEAAVTATHDFLPDGAIASYRSLVRDMYIPSVDVTVARDTSGTIVGFIGLGRGAVAADELALFGIQSPAGERDLGKIEMLFVHPDTHKKGVGRSLVHFAESCYPALLVDVNEQNTGAVAFYEHCGFVACGRSAQDKQGNPYPLVHMRKG